MEQSLQSHYKLFFSTVLKLVITYYRRLHQLSQDYALLQFYWLAPLVKLMYFGAKCLDIVRAFRDRAYQVFPFI
jgi:hypothetical protein